MARNMISTESDCTSLAFFASRTRWAICGGMNCATWISLLRSAVTRCSGSRMIVKMIVSGFAGLTAGLPESFSSTMR